MKIKNVSVDVLVWPLHEPQFWMSLSPVAPQHLLVVSVTDDDGVTGIGFSDQVPGAFTFARDGRPRPGNASRIVPEAFAPLLKGRDANHTEQLWNELFALTYARGWAVSGWSRQQYLACLAATDMALWDLKARALGLPVFRLLGAGRDRVPCYMAGGYYRAGKSVADLAAECGEYARQGFTAIKIRVGGERLEDDAERVAAVRSAIGPGVRLMVDGNDAYDSTSAVRAAELFEPYDLYWLEEPVHWYEGYSGLQRAARSIRIPIAAGEGAATRWEAAELAATGAIGFMQFDGMRTGGPTEWLKVAATCASIGIPMAPHHGPAIHAHLVAAVSNGLMVEVFADPREYDPELLQWIRWDKQREAFSEYPAIEGGHMVLPDRPGWGIEFDGDVVARRRVEPE